MTNPIQLLRDFRKWRRERYKAAVRKVAKEIAEREFCGAASQQYYRDGIIYGIEHRKEILKRVKI